MPPSSITSLSAALSFYREWGVEKARMQEIIDKQQKEIETKDKQIVEFQTKVDIVVDMILELMQCRAPPRVYALYLKEQHLCFKLTHIVRELSPSFETTQEFYHAYQNFPATIKNLLCELYLHNYVVSYDTEWNPLLYIGDIHLKALMSWIQNEINMGE